MTFYTRIDDNTLVVTKSTEDSSAAVWTKNLPDLTLNTLEDTFLSTDAEINTDSSSGSQWTRTF